MSPLGNFICNYSIIMFPNVSMIIYYVSKTGSFVCRFLKEIFANFHTFPFYMQKADVTRNGKHQPFVLVIDYFNVDNLSRSLNSIIHLAYPQHLVSYFELFSAAFLPCESLYKFIVHLLRLFINIGKILVELAFCEQIGIENGAASFDIAKMLLSPQTDWSLILFGQC